MCGGNILFDGCGEEDWQPHRLPVYGSRTHPNCTYDPPTGIYPLHIPEVERMKYFWIIIVLGVVMVCSPCPPQDGNVCLPYCWEAEEDVGGGVGSVLRARVDAIDTDGVPQYPAGLDAENKRFNRTRSEVRSWLAHTAHPYIHAV